MNTLLKIKLRKEIEDIESEISSISEKPYEYEYNSLGRAIDIRNHKRALLLAIISLEDAVKLIDHLPSGNSKHQKSAINQIVNIFSE